MKRLMSLVLTAVFVLTAMSLNATVSHAFCPFGMGGGMGMGGFGSLYGRMGGYSQNQQRSRNRGGSYNTAGSRSRQSGRSGATAQRKPTAKTVKVAKKSDQPKQPETGADQTVVAAREPAADGQPNGKQEVASADKEPASPSDTSAETPATEVKTDLELVDVRLVDDGDAAQGLGPNYRIRFRNAGSRDMNQTFSVALMSSSGKRGTARSRPVVAKVEQIKAGQVLSVDLRLPVTANTDPTANSTKRRIFVVIDSQQDLDEQDEANNLADLDQDAIDSLDAALTSSDMPTLDR